MIGTLPPLKRGATGQQAHIRAGVAALIALLALGFSPRGMGQAERAQPERMQSERAKSDQVSFRLEPRKPQTLPLRIPAGQAMLIHIRLNGGIIGVRELGPGNSRPLWLIDLGRGGDLTYVATAPTAGTYSFEMTSFERERSAELSVETAQATPLIESVSTLREAEDLLANAELVRRHWPNAPTGQNAGELFDRASALANKLNDLPLQRLILTDKARHLMFGGKSYLAAEALLEQAVALPAAQDAPQQALAWKTLSSVRYDLGEYQRAIDAGQTAFHLYEQSQDVYWQGIVLGNLASVYSELGETDQAVTTAREALKDAEQVKDIAGVVYCLSQLANLYQQQGDLESSLRTFYEGLGWVSHIPYAPLVEAEIQKDLGGFYAQIGDWVRAREALQRCIKIEGSQSDPVSLEARGLMATILLHQGAAASAEADDTEAIAMAHHLALKQNEAELLLRRSSIDLRLHHQAEAVADIQAAESVGKELASQPLQIETQSAMGDALETDHPEQAADSYRMALELAESSGEREEQSRALAGLAKTFEREGNPEEAAARIEAALKIVESSRGNLSNREEQVSYFAMHRSWYELAVDICMDLDRDFPGKGYSSLAFNYTERARARSLLDTLNSSGYTSTLPAADSLREEYARNARDIAEQQSLPVASENPARQTAAARIEKLQIEGDQLAARIRSADGRLNSTFVSRIATAEQLQKKLLDKDSVLLAYWVGERRSYRWLFTPKGVSVEALPSRPQLERLVFPLEHRLQSRHPDPASGEDLAAYSQRERSFAADLDDRLARVGSILLSRIPAGTKTILLVGDGCLMPLPFAALRVSGPTGPDYSLRRFTFSQQPSTTVALYLKEHPVEEQELHITVFADPVYSDSDSRLAVRGNATGAKLAFTDFPRLTASIAEAASIAQQVPRGEVTLRTGFDASPEDVRKLSTRDAVILHFAAHTVSVEDRPEATGIALSMWDRDGDRQAGVLWLRDIYALHLPSALVVLSGCGTDRKDTSGGEMLHNLSYAFFFAGAHSVIGSLWKVDDASTARIMSIFYRELLKKHELTGDALRAAQLRLLADPQTRSPAVWASFVLEGWPGAHAFARESLASSVAADSSDRRRR